MIFGKHINRYYLRYWYLVLLGILALTLVDYIQLEIPRIVGEIVDGLDAIVKISRGEAAEHLVPLTDAALVGYIHNLLVILIGMVVGRFIWRYTLLGFGLRSVTDLRDRMFTKNEMLATSYYNNHKTGAIMALYTNDLQSIQYALGIGIVTSFDAVVLAIMIVIRMFKINVVLALIALVPMVVLGIVGVFVSQAMSKKWKERQVAYEQLCDFTQETFAGLSVVRAFAKETLELLRFKKINQKNQEKNIEYVRLSAIVEVLLQLFLTLTLTMIVAGCSYFIWQYQLDSENLTFSVGMLTEFVSLFMILVWPMIAVGHVVSITGQAIASSKRINDLLDAKVEINDDLVTEQGKNSLLSGRIEFSHFNLELDEMHVLKDINVVIEPGQLIGIIGKTGSGKSKFVDCLMRYYNCQAGTLLFDGVDIMTIPVSRVRESIAYVPQDNFLFSDTIANNISIGKAGATLSEIEKYAILACVDANIKDFPQKYQTVLGERGVTISGGQKQRVSIARALIKEAPILILDDAVSAVDTKTEEQILRNLREIRAKQTTLIIAHRISTIKDLDKILLFEDGKVTAFAPHEELLQVSKTYREIYRMQQLDDEEFEVRS